MLKNILGVFALSFILVGCASLTPSDMPEGALPASGNGLLIASINFLDIAAASDPKHPIEVTLINQKNLTVASAIIPLMPRRNFRVIELPAGHYSWRGIYGHGAFVEFRGRMLFDIEPNTVTYAGDIDLTMDIPRLTYDLRFVDRSDLVKQEFALRYPKASQALPLKVTIIEYGQQP